MGASLLLLNFLRKPQLKTHSCSRRHFYADGGSISNVERPVIALLSLGRSVWASLMLVVLDDEVAAFELVRRHDFNLSDLLVRALLDGAVDVGL